MFITSAVNWECKVCKSDNVSWSSATALDSANLTAAPATWCVSRNGTPFLTIEYIDILWEGNIYISGA
jgi:hypothetical protein